MRAARRASRPGRPPNPPRKQNDRSRRENPEPAVDARIVFCRHAGDVVRFQKGDKLIPPDIKKEVSKVPAFFDLYCVGDDRLEPENALVKLAGLVEV